MIQLLFFRDISEYVLRSHDLIPFPILPLLAKSATILRNFLNLRRFSTVRKMPFIHRVIPEGSEANFDHLMQGYWKEALDNNVSLLPSCPSI